MSDLFTPRQLVALTTFSDLVQEARERVKRDALAADCPTTARPSTLAAPVPRPMPMQWRYILRLRWIEWLTDMVFTLRGGILASARKLEHLRFGRQALPMVWDFAEANPFSDSSGNYARCG